MAEDLADLYENAPCGYISLGPDGHIVKSNATLTRWIGFSREALLGKRLHDLLNIPGAIFYETHFAPLLRMQGFFDEVALDMATADGARMPVLANAVERRDDAGALLFTRLTIFRATERRRYERELVEARAAAERGLELERAASELREQFVAVLGHDLRNPLAGIQGALNRIERKGAEAATPEIVALMLQSTERMNALIDDVLDLTRSRLGGGLPVDIERQVPLEATLAQIVDELRIAHPDQRIDARYALTEAVDCDPERMGQLLSNLLGNALTHGSGEQPITVEAMSERGQLRLSVANGGIPIPPAAMERLFHPFCRGEVRPGRRKGLGLGLFIASEIARMHTGSLTVTSDERQTCFTLLMPTRHVEGDAAGAERG